MNIIADLISQNDYLAVWSARRRTPRYIKVKQRGRTGDLVTIVLAEGPTQTVHKDQQVRVASRTRTR